MIHHWSASKQPNLTTLTCEPLEQPDGFSRWCPSPPAFSCLFVPKMMLIAGEAMVGVQRLRDGWSTGCKIWSLIYICIFCLLGETLYYNRTAVGVMDCGWLPFGDSHPKVGLTLTFFSCRKDVFACCYQHSMCKQIFTLNGVCLWSSDQLRSKDTVTSRFGGWAVFLQWGLTQWA